MFSVIKRYWGVMAIIIVGLIVMSKVNVHAEETPNAGLITVDLVIFAGQSNMSGIGGNVDEAPGVPRNCGYEFRNGQDPMGLYEVKEPFGDKESGYTSDPSGSRGGTIVSAFMNRYYNSTGIPVMGVSAAKGGTAMEYWLKPEVSSELVKKYDDAISWCGANNVNVRNKYVVWLQGESDAINGNTADNYIKNMKDLFAPLFAKGLQQVFIISPGNLEGVPGAFDNIINAQKKLAQTDGHFSFATGTLRDLDNAYLVDGIHYNQAALNMVGTQAGTVAAVYSSNPH